MDFGGVEGRDDNDFSNILQGGGGIARNSYVSRIWESQETQDQSLEFAISGAALYQRSSHNQSSCEVQANEQRG